MERPVDPIVAPLETSNPPGRPWSLRLARACRRGVELRDTGRALAAVLEELRDAAGAARAFLLEADSAPARGRILAAVVPASREPTVSWTVATQALAADRPVYLAGARQLPAAATGPSFRAMALHSAVAISVPRPRGPRTAIVLDSGGPLAFDAASWEAAGRAFAALAALLLDAGAGTLPPEVEAAGGPRLVGASAVMRRLLDGVARAAAVPLPALILGATGTGKELVARALHERGPRRGRPFVAVNCSAIAETLLERELFGALRGAYTGADRDHEGLFRRAAGGTVFLDEIGDMPPQLQVKLLRVLQEGAVRPVGGLDEVPVDVRVVAATHRDLSRLAREGRFRDDLRYRLAVLVLKIPPLNERRDDIRALSDHLLDRLAGRCRLKAARLTAPALASLTNQPWPGNVRELEAVLARALVRTGGGTIDVGDLDFEPGWPAGRGGSGALDPEHAMIVEAVARARGNLTAAAALIGWSRQKLYRRMDALALPRIAGRRRLTAQDSGTGAA